MAFSEFDEFLQEIETEFNIHIDPADSWYFTSARSVTNYLTSRLNQKQETPLPCPSLLRFNRLRSILVDHFGATRKDIKPNAPIQSLLTGNIQQQWAKLHTLIGSPYIAPLQKSIPFYLLYVLACFAIFLILLFVLTPGRCAPPVDTLFSPFVVAGFSALALWIFLRAFVMPQMDNRIPPYYSTLAPFIRMTSLSMPPSRSNNQTDAMVQRVRQLVAQHFKLAIEQLNANTHFSDYPDIKTESLSSIVEAEFNIPIKKANIENLTNCKKLADYIYSRLIHRDIADPRCMSQTQFYHLRAILINEFGAKRQDVTPQTRMQQLLGKNIQQNWEKLQQHISSQTLSPLRCHPIFHGLAALISFGFAAALWSKNIPLLGVIPAGLILWSILGHLIPHKFYNHIPPDLDTVGALSSFVDQPVSSAQWRTHPEYILLRVRQIGAKWFGSCLYPEEIHPDADFFDDLDVE